ncbi:MAG TPA: aminomethyl-transferring glycine dehydrogenase [bacterium]|nr:aminomethyl-transferring glycine dehydrogenase [bacterium]HPG44359.1 aminomethyl-transferring glycine dehydrogenase [bacterium]HPM96917.1 aminomethyl-transferring glycine dehydrogenase [bacterium]
MTSEHLFEDRHIGPTAEEIQQMLKTVQAASREELIEQTVPADIRIAEKKAATGKSEQEYLDRMRSIAVTNKLFRSYIGLGYYGTYMPSVVQRTIFENPGWYTQYTPYQSEIAQGRLEALLNFQTVISDLTAMPVANASLLDEGTAAAEAMTMLHRLSNRAGNAVRNTFFVDQNVFPQTLQVVIGRAEPLGIEIAVGDYAQFEPNDDFFGVLLQYPDQFGQVNDYHHFIARMHEQNIQVVVAADLLSLLLLTPPGEMGADAVVGSSQRFGVPMGFGGPHAAYFATREEAVRQMPGRIIGVSVDSTGKSAYRMALQTREQHIRREKATSNICTAQALLAILAGMYAVYHGPQGLRALAERIHGFARQLDAGLQKLGYRQNNSVYFDTLHIELKRAEQAEKIHHLSRSAGINLRLIDSLHIGISLDETVRPKDVQDLLAIFAEAADQPAPEIDWHRPYPPQIIPGELQRKSAVLTHPIFNTLHSETLILRYIKKLENRDLALNTSMIALGSCTMKLNAATEMMPLSWPEFSNLHPFAPADQSAGYRRIFADLAESLAEITGLAGVSLQPNSGAQGELTGLLVIRAYHIAQGAKERKVVLIPTSAHGTNPASAVMAGMQVVLVACDDQGNIDVNDLRQKAEQHRDQLAALMVTYPSTHGVYESRIREICDIVHQMGGQVYMDGANMNAQVGLTNPAKIGADVCHLNLHKTFAIPHGGGGPGAGPICAAKHLIPFLPGHVFASGQSNSAIPAVASAPYGSASILLISYGYIQMMGSQGLKHASEMAILNANYIAARLQNHFPVLYKGKNGRVAHEMIIDLRPFKSAGIEAEDIAKRLMDYGFHAPTVSFPVHGTFMIEPTESEDKGELDRFCAAMLQIHSEIMEIQNGKMDSKDNPLKNAPHTAQVCAADNWAHPYSREIAAFPLPYVRDNKFWPAVGRIDNTAGDRHLVCTCPPIEDYL